MAPTPKSAERRQRSNSGGLQIVPSAEPRVVPSPPDGLLPDVIDMWDAYWHSDLSQLVTTATDMPGLRRLFRYYDDMERAWAIYRSAPEIAGSRGQTRISHFAKHIRETEPLVARLEDRYGLSPKSRLELGITFGDAARSLEDLYSAATRDDSLPAGLFVVGVPAPEVREPRRVGPDVGTDPGRTRHVRSARRVVDRAKQRPR